MWRSRDFREIWRSGHVLRDASLAASARETPLKNARWIWHREGNPAASAPLGTRDFRCAVPIRGAVAAATFTMTADNSFVLLVNGGQAGSGDDFHQPYAMEVTRLLKPGTNVFTVIAANSGTKPNPAGLIGALSIDFRDGTKLLLSTDQQWTSGLTSDGAQQPAMELGAWDMAPWNLAAPARCPGLYPTYEATAEILAQMGVVPDFECDGDLRDTHRHENDADIYLVGNRTVAPLSAECRFRVTGRRPELWDPLTGRRCALPEFRRQDGRTCVPLQFAAGQTFFVVFRDAVAIPTPGKNFPELKSGGEITGPWEVTFDPKWGGPQKPVTFETLQDWTKRGEDGIRYYSGTAIYRKTFAWPGTAGPDKQLAFWTWARCRIWRRCNSTATSWASSCAVEVALPANLLKPTGNRLEIRVANLWPIRLIKDAGLPQKQRLTWTTWNPYPPTHPLFSSGLLGPVRLLESSGLDLSRR